MNKTDEQAFQEEMASVRRLKSDNRHRLAASNPIAGPMSKSSIRKHEFEIEKTAGNEQAGLLNDAAGHPLSFAREGLPRKYLKRLGTRHCPVEDSFDLHGMTEITAKMALNRFLAGSIEHGLACIRVVHGKGLRSEGPPVLKLMSWKLLRTHPTVWALKPCAPADGGSGAVLVLLRIEQGVPA